MPNRVDTMKMKSPSAILRKLSFRRIQPRPAPSAVAPSPVTSRFHRELAAKLDALRSLGTSGEQLGLVHFLDASITTQKIALDSLANISYNNDVDLGAMEEYLDNNIDVLDACNYYVDKINHMKKYVDSLRLVAHKVDVRSHKPNCAATVRALEHLDSCRDMEESFKAMAKRGSCLRRMLRQRVVACHETEFSEILSGSKAMALMGCRFLELALCFGFKIGFPLMKCSSMPNSSSWLRLLQDLGNQLAEHGSSEKGKSLSFLMIELQKTVVAARELKEQMKSKREKEVVESSVERLKRCCRELEDRLEVIEGRVKDLYKSLIDVRMVLLGILSQA